MTKTGGIVADARPGSFDSRDSGIDLVGNILWGTHFCAVHDSGMDLRQMVVQYFKAGLASNELCLWVTADDGSATEAEAALAAAIPELQRLMDGGRLAILTRKDYDQSADAVLARLDAAVAAGRDGLRLAAHCDSRTSPQRSFDCYGLNAPGVHNILTVCLYSRAGMDALQMMDVVKAHSFALLQSGSKWEIVESTEARQARGALKHSEEKLESLFNSMSEGFAYHRIVLDGAGKPVDYVFLQVNEAFEQQTGLKGKDIIGRRVTEVLAGIENDPADWIGRYGRVALTGEPIRFESFAEPLEKWYVVSSFSSHRGFFAATFSDITDRKRTELALKDAMTRLEQSNTELQQFAYVASHDLQEPLRTVVSFLQLLRRRYADDLDQDAREFIDFAVGGAHQMQTLINDLLAFSRLGSQEKEFTRVESGEALDQALKHLGAAISDSGAEVTAGDLPAVTGDASMLTQLLQNLVSNAIKFRGEEPPRIRVEAERREGDWLLSVSDNGIGIDPEFGERIFNIFQRLHSKTEYPGTGIGLAVCKRVVERHGGRIWVESTPGEGATFYFTIPAKKDEPG